MSEPLGKMYWCRTEEEQFLIDYMRENFLVYRIESEGVFERTVANCNWVKIGDIAGTTGTGYRRIWIGDKGYAAHRLMYLWINKRWPIGEINHINHNALDNRPDNLREVTHQEVGRNQKKRNTNKSGEPGVSYMAKRDLWEVVIRKKEGGHFRKKFKLKHDAVKCARSAYKLLGYHSNHGKVYE